MIAKLLSEKMFLFCPFFRLDIGAYLMAGDFLCFLDYGIAECDGKIIELPTRQL